MHVNLLPASFLRRVTLRRLARKWGVALVTSLLAAGGLLGEQYLALLSARQAARLTALQAKDVRLLRTEIERMTAETGNLESEIARLQQARPHDYTLPVIGVVSSSVKELAGKVQLKQLTTQIAPTASGSPVATPGIGNRPVGATAAPAGAGNDLVIEGVAENAGVIAAFVDVLRGTHLFHRVDLAATSETAGASGPVRQFRVNCRF